MPRQRPRRRRRRGPSAEPQSSIQVNEDANLQIETSQQRSRIPPASVVAALGLGIWLGWAFGGAGGIVEQITLWIGVLMAGLGGGRLFRRSLQNRQNGRHRRG